mmetsp:Transcript_39663/g.55075  ORF Transcript_39663/g.55075 Transcript_39663/m.55075 type:complete len:137 (+) Transcript_39663:116-526(+)|eukprot:CAMPEP_0196579870 /NCGR_PEP_ID=MMETSP1081-20130531/25359_1 /TAXON_ID=36882 /ORGANISM="Pyramimonas amylifera, Strain CCMP720" /LENGTH=136 /DNA_ID=CAMNT_0041899579 /DNA_START=113 /DNA_END=523 /DNA_ORIENTATION=-
MDVIKQFFTKELPTHLQNLPIPESLEGFSKLSQDEWKSLAPFLMCGFLFFLYSVRIFLSVITPSPKRRINKSVKLHESKVVDSCSIDTDFTKAPDVEKLVFCRCWKSSKWPMCDGSHVKHNKETGDNLGPLIVKKA